MIAEMEQVQTKGRKQRRWLIDWLGSFWRDPEQEPRRYRCRICGQRTALPGVCEICHRELGSGE
jgi:hypothetical protein|nr:MAG: hypothetical protein KatS3mg041_0057 [Bacteroidota bacterium]